MSDGNSPAFPTSIRIAICALAAALALAWGAFQNWCGDRTIAAGDLPTPRCEHGWPWRFLIRQADTSVFPYPRLSLWTPGSDVADLSTALLAVDIACALGIAVAAGFIAWAVSPYLLGDLRLSLRTGLLLFIPFGIVLIYGRYYRALYIEHDRFLNTITAMGGYFNVEPGNPDWLRELLPTTWRVHDTHPYLEIRNSLAVLGPERFNESLIALMECNAYANEVTKLVADDMPGLADGHLIHLSNLRSLEELRISQSCVTDASVATIARMERLKLVDISGTRISATGVAKLKRLRPEIIIIY